MPRLARPDGVELAWEQRGSGPAVVVVWPWNPSPHSLEPLVADLARDHRVIVYAARGTGDSTRVGPYDAATDAAALAAVVETAADGQAVIVAPLDAIVQAADAAVRLPTAIMAVVAVSSMLRSRADSGSEALADSPEVLRAMLQMIEISYRAGLHALVSAGNPDLDEAEVQRRVEETLDFAEPERRQSACAAGCAGRDCSSRRAPSRTGLVAHHPDQPVAPPDLHERVREQLPQAHVDLLADGHSTIPN